MLARAWFSDWTANSNKAAAPARPPINAPKNIPFPFLLSEFSVKALSIFSSPDRPDPGKREVYSTSGFTDRSNGHAPSRRI
jgi:hypothetical protein